MCIFYIKLMSLHQAISTHHVRVMLGYVVRRDCGRGTLNMVLNHNGAFKHGFEPPR